MSDEQPKVVRLSALGRGAVATLLVTGPEALAAVDRLFRARSGRRLAESPTDRIVVGHFGDQQDAGEEIVARRVSDCEVLLHCHGGTAAVARIESLLAGQGTVVIDWPTWAAGAHDDPLQAEALIALAEATTERSAAILLDQYQGALRGALDKIKSALDAGDRDTAAEQLDGLLARADFGLHLTEPWRVVLAGPRNSGKSSLVNALLGYARAIVQATPGTTRDVLTARAAVDGWPVQLVDTAGLGQGAHPVEQEGIRRAQEQLATADLLLLVFDRSQPFIKQDGALLEGATAGLSSSGTRQSHRDRLLMVHNKSDLPSSPGDRPEGIPTSALTGEGVPELLRWIADRLAPDPPAPGQAVPWTLRQIAHLAAARAALADGKTEQSRASLLEM